MEKNRNKNKMTNKEELTLLGASGLWNQGGAAAAGGSGAGAFSSGPTPGTTVEDAANAGYPEWMVHEDYALLQAIQVPPGGKSYLFFACILFDSFLKLCWRRSDLARQIR